MMGPNDNTRWRYCVSSCKLIVHANVLGDNSSIDDLGHSFSFDLNHTGPSHHKVLSFNCFGLQPREIISAGLSVDLTYPYSAAAVNV